MCRIWPSCLTCTCWGIQLRQAFLSSKQVQFLSGVRNGQRWMCACIGSFVNHRQKVAQRNRLNSTFPMARPARLCHFLVWGISHNSNLFRWMSNNTYCTWRVWPSGYGWDGSWRARLGGTRISSYAEERRCQSSPTPVTDWPTGCGIDHLNERTAIFTLAIGQGI